MQTRTRQRSERFCKPNDAPRAKPRLCVKTMLCDVRLLPPLNVEQSFNVTEKWFPNGHERIDITFIVIGPTDSGQHLRLQRLTVGDNREPVVWKVVDVSVVLRFESAQHLGEVSNSGVSEWHFEHGFNAPRGAAIRCVDNCVAALSVKFPRNKMLCEPIEMFGNEFHLSRPTEGFYDTASRRSQQT